MLIIQASKRCLKYVLYIVQIPFRNGIRHKSMKKMTNGYLGLSEEHKSLASLAS
jgi:hypothetical protein